MEVHVSARFYPPAFILLPGVVCLHRILHRKLLAPRVDGCLVRPRLLDAALQSRTVIAQGPAGSGKTVFLVQWLQARGRLAVYYELNEADRDGSVFAAHLLTGLVGVWPDWSPPPRAHEDAGELAVALVSEAGRRPPLDLVLDRLECGFGEAYLADFLSVLIRYAPPGLTLAVGARMPPALEPEAARLLPQPLSASALAFTLQEAQALLGVGDWEECLAVSGGLPLALTLWRQHGQGWRHALANALLSGMPPHLPVDRARSLVTGLLAGQLPLEQFCQILLAPPAVEWLWRDLHQARSLFLQGEFRSAQTLLGRLWDDARGRGDQAVMGAVALLTGETYYGLGEYAQATEWYRVAFSTDPQLEVTGTHSLPFVLRDQGFMDEAEALARRMVAATSTGADLQAHSFARMQYAWLCADRERHAEAATEILEAERLGLASSEPLYGLIAMIHRAGVASMAGNAAEYRQVAERAYTLTRGRSPWLEALTGYILAGVLGAWGDRETASRMMAGSLEVLMRIDAKFQVHMLLAIAAAFAWKAGLHDEARARFDRALAMAAAEGYVYILTAERFGSRPLLIDALVRGVEVSHCQRALALMGRRALPDLLALAASAQPGARRAAVYPLATIGGEEAEAVIRSLLHDPDEGVRTAALLAVKAASGPAAAPLAQPPVEEPKRVEVALLGPMVVKVAGRPVQSWRTGKSRDLLAFLLLSGNRPFSRDQLAEALWPEADAESATRLLHTALHHLRRALGPGAEGLVAFAGGAYQLVREHALLQVDLDQFQRLAASGGESGWRSAVGLYRGELLDGLDYAWCEGPRVRARTLYLDCLRHLSHSLAQAGRWSDSVEFLQLFVQADPLAEDGHVALMECYAALGNRNAAIQQYHTLAHLLDEELGLSPGCKAEALYRQLLN